MDKTEGWINGSNTEYVTSTNSMSPDVLTWWVMDWAPLIPEGSNIYMFCDSASLVGSCEGMRWERRKRSRIVPEDHRLSNTREGDYIYRESLTSSLWSLHKYASIVLLFTAKLFPRAPLQQHTMQKGEPTFFSLGLPLNPISCVNFSRIDPVLSYHLPWTQKWANHAHPVQILLHGTII